MYTTIVFLIGVVVGVAVGVAIAGFLYAAREHNTEWRS